MEGKGGEAKPYERSVTLFGFEGAAKSARSGKEEYAPLAQLVEQLTLNQWVPGSSP